MQLVTTVPQRAERYSYPVIHGTGAPTPFHGDTFQTYIDEASSLLYVKDATGHWEPWFNFTGSSDVVENLRFSGKDRPSPYVGVAGDYYMQLSADGPVLWGPRHESTWSEYGLYTEVSLDNSAFFYSYHAGLVSVEPLNVNHNITVDRSTGVYRAALARFDLGDLVICDPFITSVVYVSLKITNTPFAGYVNINAGAIDGVSQHTASGYQAGGGAGAVISTGLGESAYQTWLRMGNVGDENDFLASLRGADGESVRGPAGRGIPVGGSPGDLLVKNSDQDYDLMWQTPEPELPSGGQPDQILRQTSNGLTWSDETVELPSGGQPDQILRQTLGGPVWSPETPDIDTITVYRAGITAADSSDTEVAT